MRGKRADLLIHDDIMDATSYALEACAPKGFRRVKCTPSPIPKYPLDTAAKLALIRAAGWYYDTKTRRLTNPEGEPVWWIQPHWKTEPLNRAFHFFINNAGKDWGAVAERTKTMTARSVANTMRIGLEREFAKVYASAFDTSYNPKGPFLKDLIGENVGSS